MLFPTCEEICHHLKTQHYASVPFGLHRDLIEDAVSSFFRFLEEPPFVKEGIQFRISDIHRRGDVGYQKRSPEDHIYNDSKEFFHFHPAIFEKYGTLLIENPVIKDFCLKALPIWHATYWTIVRILKALDKRFQGVSDTVLDNDCPHIVLRFLRYDWAESGKYLAKPHYDAGSFTLAIAESCEGLRIGSGPDNLKKVIHCDQNAIFMLSSNIQKLMPSSDLLPGWHDVVQLDETKIGKPFARWAVVAFIEGYGVEALSREETHKWYDQAFA